MFAIDSNTDIQITRGDTAVIAINLELEDGTEYVLAAGDTLLFTVKTNVRTKDILIQKAFTDRQIKINPADTDNLPYGTYYYDVQLSTVGGDVFTVITPHKFKVSAEVTWNE